MNIDLFVKLTSRAWALPILSSLHAGVPGRQASLRTATGASRNAFVQSLDHLFELGLLERNPGHGHPLRPEFRLTDLGRSAAAMAEKIDKASADEDRALLRRSWTLPVLTSLQTPRHFNDIKRDLSTITDRALSQSLKAMESKLWVERSVSHDTRPPRSVYIAVNTGSAISSITATEVLMRSSVVAA